MRLCMWLEHEGTLEYPDKDCADRATTTIIVANHATRLGCTGAIYCNLE